jgi:hypothetical protein
VAADQLVDEGVVVRGADEESGEAVVTVRTTVNGGEGDRVRTLDEGAMPTLHELRSESREQPDGQLPDM